MDKLVRGGDTYNTRSFGSFMNPSSAEVVITQLLSKARAGFSIVLDFDSRMIAS